MTKQLNTRVSDLHYYMFQEIQKEMTACGIHMNKRQLLEYMINETSKTLKDTSERYSK